MAKKKRTRTTPEERARWEENQRRLELIIARRLKADAADPAVAARLAEGARALEEAS